MSFFNDLKLFKNNIPKNVSGFFEIMSAPALNGSPSIGSYHYFVSRISISLTLYNI